MSTVHEELLQQQLENFTIQRHDFMNYFQVIRGYIQLNMPEKALAYMDEDLISLLPQQTISRIAEKTVVAVLLNLYFKFGKQGIKMAVKYPDEMKSKEFWTARWLTEYADRLYGYTKEWVANIPAVHDLEDLSAEIALNATEKGFTLEYKLYRQQELISQDLLALP